MSNQFLAENVQRIHDLHEKGISASEISKIIGCSIKTVKRWISYGEYELKDDARIILRENWRAHCDTCIYAFRKPVESHSIYSSAACELEVENKKTVADGWTQSQMFQSRNGYLPKKTCHNY